MPVTVSVKNTRFLPLGNLHLNRGETEGEQTISKYITCQKVLERKIKLGKGSGGTAFYLESGGSQ